MGVGADALSGHAARCLRGAPGPAPALSMYAPYCYHLHMRTSVIFDDDLVTEARELGINVSEAARQGLRQAIRRRRAERDRAAYLALPEVDGADWDDAEAWGEP
ncbi:MAG: type II toxin-antitoxin system CcdA family antitoxin [Nitriliruptoraceae bacterium]